MRKEFEEQQKKSVLTGGAAKANPLQNFDMAAWMAGQTTATTTGQDQGEGSSSTGGGGGGAKARKRG